MKTVFRVLLTIAIFVMGYLCVMSILTPINFNKTKDFREKAIIQRLMDIRQAEIEFNKQYGHYTADADSLVNFVKNGQVPIVLKVGTLTDDQMKNGLTEKKVAAILLKGNKKEIEDNGLTGFRRDTSYVSVYDKYFKDQYPLEKLQKLVVVPYSHGKNFVLKTRMYKNAKSGIIIPLFEADAPYEYYLSDLNEQQLVNLEDTQTKLGKYCGLKVGSVDEPNNNAGNWE